MLLYVAGVRENTRRKQGSYGARLAGEATGSSQSTGATTIDCGDQYEKPCHPPTMRTTWVDSCSFCDSFKVPQMYVWVIGLLTLQNRVARLCLLIVYVLWNVCLSLFHTYVIQGMVRPKTPDVTWMMQLVRLYNLSFGCTSIIFHVFIPALLDLLRLSSFYVTHCLVTLMMWL